MRLLIDMNLSPSWVEFFRRQGWEAEHWSRIGAPTATDATILDYARKNNFIIFTNDLDFGALLAAGSEHAPSVFQIRTHDVLPEAIGPRIVTMLRHLAEPLQAGALVSMDELTQRVRILPIEQG